MGRGPKFKGQLDKRRQGNKNHHKEREETSQQKFSGGGEIEKQNRLGELLRGKKIVFVSDADQQEAILRDLNQLFSRLNSDMSYGFSYDVLDYNSFLTSPILTNPNSPVCNADILVLKGSSILESPEGFGALEDKLHSICQGNSTAIVLHLENNAIFFKCAPLFENKLVHSFILSASIKNGDLVRQGANVLEKLSENGGKCEN